jgi:hypothetical protein
MQSGSILSYGYSCKQPESNEVSLVFVYVLLVTTAITLRYVLSYRTFSSCRKLQQSCYIVDYSDILTFGFWTEFF